MPNYSKMRLDKRNSGSPEIRNVENTDGNCVIHCIQYDGDSIREKKSASMEECALYRNNPGVLWVNVDGANQEEVLKSLGQCFGLHPLVLEDISDTRQRPKIEDHESYLYVILKMMSYDPTTNKIIIEQTSMVIGENFVLSFGEREGDVFDVVRERLRQGTGRIRKMGADYLAYNLLDAIIDNYFIVLEALGDEIEAVEEELLRKPHTRVLGQIHILKREMMFMHKAIWPLREVIGVLSRGESALVKQGTLAYLRNVYDNTVQAMDTTEIYRDMLSGMLDVYLSSTSNRMNEIMKVLTIISTIFIPLTFIAGVYGMNFRVMPELEWKWGYPGSLLLMGGVAVIMVLYFKRRKWL